MGGRRAVRGESGRERGCERAEGEGEGLWGGEGRERGCERAQRL